MSKFAIGVDIGGTTVKLGLFNREGEVLDKWEIPTRKENGGAQILPDVAASIQEKLQEKGISEENLAGIGVGAPGPIDEKGNIIGGAVNLGWGEFNIPQALREQLKLGESVAIKAANDANAAAFGEMWQGGGKGHKNLVAVTLGTGVGGGIIVDGHILAGYTGSGGEIGHIHIEDREAEFCNCGQKGCLEQYASATGIARLADRYLTACDKPSVLRGKKTSAKAVFDAVKEGDEAAVEIAEQFGNYLGKGLGIVAAIVNPEIFVIGGGVSKAGEILLEYIRPAFMENAFMACKKTEFSLATLGNDAGIFGAAGLILRQGQ